MTDDRFKARSVRRDLALLVESEGFGQRTFSLAARLTPAGHRRDMWEALHELERQTGGHVADLVEAHGLNLGFPDRVGQIIGTPAGVGLCALPRRAQMNVTFQGTRPYLPAFERLARHFAIDGRRTFFDYVVDHEQAIRELARLELTDADNTLTPVTDLLGDTAWIPIGT